MKPRREVIERIRRLRRLGDSPNPFEAAAARRKADGLAKRHNVTEEEIRGGMSSLPDFLWNVLEELERRGRDE